MNPNQIFISQQIERITGSRTNLMSILSNLFMTLCSLCSQQLYVPGFTSNRPQAELKNVQAINPFWGSALLQLGLVRLGWLGMQKLELRWRFFCAQIALITSTNVNCMFYTVAESSFVQSDFYLPSIIIEYTNSLHNMNFTNVRLQNSSKHQ